MWKRRGMAGPHGGRRSARVGLTAMLGLNCNLNLNLSLSLNSCKF
jgi:hypothetical protein